MTPSTKRLSTLDLCLPLAFVSLVGVGVALSTPTQEPTFEVHPVAGAVAYLEGAGGNIGLFNGEDGFLLIDTQLARHRDGVVGAVAEHLGVDPTLATAAPLYLVNTHWHGDHVGNNEAFGRSMVPIIAHAGVRARMLPAEGVEGRSQAYPRAALPTLTYQDELALHLNGESIRVVHYPAAHTDGDSVVFFETSKVVHCGDLFFNGRFPFIDVGSGGSPEGYVAAMEAILAATDADWRLIPGHGPLASRADLEAALAVLRDCIERVRGALAAGQTLEEMVAADLLGDHAEAWSWRFITAERLLGDLAAGLSK